MTDAKLDPKFPQLHKNAGDYSMKLRRNMKVMAIAVLIAVATIAGCSRRTPPPAPPPPAPPPPPVVQPAPPPPPPPQPKPTPPPPAPAPLTEEQIYQKTPLDELSRQLSEVRFDYDQFSIRDDQRPALQKNADWMRKWSTSRVQVEGHADARGTNEYNLALGERRANAVRDYKVGLGIAAERITVVSRGEESPACADDSDACHAQNRRGRFAVTQR
jgi:peptidoglycan-associated lipoprotein